MTFNELFAGAFTTLGVGVMGYAILREVRRRGTRRRRFRDRENLQLDDIYQSYYASSGLTRSEVLYYWREISRLLRVEPGTLRPTDRFDQELRPLRGHEVGDELEEIVELYNDVARSKQKSLPEGPFATVNDLVLFLASSRIGA